MIKILLSSWFLLINIFWLLSEAGVESNVLFDDTLEFNSDSGLLTVDIGIGFGVEETIEVVFNLARRSGINDENGIEVEVRLDNKFLITSFINSGLKPEDIPEAGGGVKDVSICWRGEIVPFDWLFNTFGKQELFVDSDDDDEQAGEIVCGFLSGAGTGVTFGMCTS